MLSHVTAMLVRLSFQEKKFAVDSYSGKISTKAKLDFESTRDYNLTILVQV